MATVNLTTTPTQIDDGTSYTVLVTNTGAVEVDLSRGGRLRPQQSRTVYPEGAALTAAATSGTGTVTTSTTAKPLPNPSDPATLAASSAFTGTYAQAFMPEKYGAVGDGVTDDTAAVQAAITAAVAAKGEVRLTKKYLITSGLTASGRVTIKGTGAFDGALLANCSLVTASTSIDLLTIAGDGSVLEDFAVINTATTPTAGSGVKFASGWWSHMTRVGISGFYDNLVHANSCYYSVTDCWFIDPVRYGVSMSNTVNQDYGEVMFHGNVVTTWAKTRNPTAAIHWTSGGGLKFINNKINGSTQPTGPGGSNSAGRFVRGFDMQIADGLATADLVITGNSVENCSSVYLYVSQQDGGTGTGTLNNVIITSNEFGFNGNGKGIQLRSVSNASGGVQNILVADNVFYGIPGNGIYASQVTGLHIGTNKFVGSGGTATGTELVWLDQYTYNVSVDPQNVEGDQRTLIQNNEWSLLQNDNYPKALIDHTYEREIPLTSSTSTYVVLYSFIPPDYSAGTLKLTVAGNVSGKGSAVWEGVRSWTHEAAGVTVATVGTDVAAGFGFDVLVDTATTSGRVYLKIRLNSVVGGTNICGRATLVVNGPVKTLIKGA
jgi:hypothetical protein